MINAKKLTKKDFDFYAWEQKRYKQFHEITREDFLCGVLLTELVNKFKVPGLTYILTQKKDLFSYYVPKTKLTEACIYMTGGPTQLAATLLHEFAHHVTVQKGGVGHGKEFKKNLIKVYAYVNKKWKIIPIR